MTKFPNAADRLHYLFASMDAIRVRCPRCDARAGLNCRSAAGRESFPSHAARIRKVQEQPR